MKYGALAYLEGGNSLTLLEINIELVSGLSGGVLAGSNLNQITIMNSNLKDIQSSSVAGGFWLYNLNYLKIVDCSFINIASHSSNGGGGFMALENNNIVIIDKCELFNISSIMNGVLASSVFNNSLNVTNSQISLYFDFGLFYFNIQNKIYFGQNVLEINNGIYNSIFFYANSTNFITFNDSNISVKNSFSPLKYYGFQLLSQNYLILVNTYFSIDKCFTFLEGYDGSQIFVNKTTFTNFSTVNLKLIYVENSNLTCFDVNFKNNNLNVTIQALNSTIFIHKFNYFPFISDSKFFQGTNNSLTLIHGHFLNKNTSLSSQVIYGQYLNLLLYDVSFIQFASKSMDSCIQLYDSSVTLMKCFAGFNAAKINGGFINIRNLNSTQPTKLSVHSQKSLFFKNKGKNMGGCIYMETFPNKTITTKSRINLQRNNFIMNIAFRGGVAAEKNIIFINLCKNKFLKSKAVSQNSFNKSKGGINYVDNSDLANLDVSLNFNSSFNNLTWNRAEIGGGFYFYRCPFSSLISHKNKFFQNSAVYYGDIYASDSITVRFLTFEKYLDKLPNLLLDTYKKATIISIKSGQSYPDCLLMINGYDYFGSITYYTDEDFLTNLNITASDVNLAYSNIFQPTSYNGFLCFNGNFQRNQLPIPITYSYDLISSFPSALMKVQEKKFTLTLKFSQCSIGERMSEDFKCLPCLKSYFSFEYKFSSFTDVCQSCETQNFYCFGGGNYTVKPGHWRINDNSIIIYKCPNELACLGDPRNFSDPTTDFNEIYASSSCAPGYHGILCAECDDNYGFLDGYLCSECSNQIYYVRVFSNLILRIMFTLYLINISINMCLSLSTDKPDTSRIIGTNLLKIFTNHLQILGIILNFPISFPSEILDMSGYLLSVSPNVSEAFSVECILKQIPLMLSLQYFKLIVAGIYPMVLVLLYFFFVFSMKNCKKYFWSRNSNEKNPNPSITNRGTLSRLSIKYRDVALTVFTLVTLTCFADISKMTLSMFGCVDLGDGQTSKRVLFIDFRVDCDSEYHKMWIKKLASPILIFFLFCYPLYVIINIMKGLKDNENKPLFKFKFGYFFYAYQRKYFFWDFIILLRKLFLIFVNSFFFSRITETIPIYPIVLVLFMMIVAYILQVNLKPWQWKDFYMINDMEELSLIISNFSIVIAIFFLSYPNLDKIVFVFLMIFMFLLNASFFIFWVKHYYCYYLKQRLAKINFLPFRKKKNDDAKVDFGKNLELKKKVPIKVKNVVRIGVQTSLKKNSKLTDNEKNQGQTTHKIANLSENR